MVFKPEKSSLLTDGSKAGFIVKNGLTHRPESADSGVRSPEVSDAVMTDLQNKFAHVQWRKHANDEKIREAIELSKHMHEREVMLHFSINHEGERGRWTEAIVRDELTRPAEISETFMRDWEKHAEVDRVRQLQETKLHLESIKRVERALNSKLKASSRKDSGDADATNSNGDDGERTNRRRLGSQHSPDDAALGERLKTLRGDMKKKRGELRRAGRQGDFRSTGFTAKGYKTGRGQ